MATNNYIENYNMAVRQSRGLKTKLPVTLSGTSSNLAVGGTLAVTGTSTFTGVATFTAAPVFNGGRVATVAASSSATVTLTAAQSGGIFLMDRASGTQYTLPAPVVGLQYEFYDSVLQTTGANVVVTDAGTTFVTGSIVAFSGENVTPSATLGPKQFAGNGSSHIKVTTNGTTTGGGIGTWLRAVCVSSTLWYITGVVNSPSGSIATPFST